jgi:hypothetical protein
MLDLLNRFWIAIPLSYAVTVHGLIAGFRRGGVPIERRFVRALPTGLPVTICVLIAWNIIISIAEPPAPPDNSPS